MPVILRFGGIEVRIYFNDVDRHRSPHIHVWNGRTDSVVEIGTWRVLAGRAIDRKLERFLEEHRDIIKRAWTEHNPETPLE